MFKAYFDCGENCVKVIRPAKDKKEFISMYGGNGEIIKLEEVTKDYTLAPDRIISDLQRLGYGEVEAYAIAECVRRTYENCVDW